MTTNLALWLAIRRACWRILYGVLSARWIVASGRQRRIEEIAAAIQQGRGAYLNRQYTTHRHRRCRAVPDLGVALSWPPAGGFRASRDPLRRRGLHRHERVGTHVHRPEHRPASTSNRQLQSRFAAAPHRMLVWASACSAWAY